MAARQAAASTAECSLSWAPCSAEASCAHCTWGRVLQGWQPGLSDGGCLGCSVERLGRAATSLAALYRLHGDSWVDRPGALHLAIIGIDEQEGSCPEDFLALHIGPMVQHLCSVGARLEALHVHAVGPCLPWASSRCETFQASVSTRAGASTSVTWSERGSSPPRTFLSPSAPALEPAVFGSQLKFRSAPAGEEPETAQLEVHLRSSRSGWEGYADQWASREPGCEDPRTSTSLLLAPNAGLWGYDSWDAALQRMLSDASQSFHAVFTAYSFTECEEDEEKLLREAGRLKVSLRQAWEPEPNPFGATHVADDKYGVVNNHHWQCITVGNATV